MVTMQSEDDIGKGVVRIRSWAEFKRLVESFKPKAIVYNIEQNGLSPKREFNQSEGLYCPLGQPITFFLILRKVSGLRRRVSS